MNHNQTPDEWSQLNVRMAVLAFTKRPIFRSDTHIGRITGTANPQNEAIQSSPQKDAETLRLCRSSIFSLEYLWININQAVNVLII